MKRYSPLLLLFTLMLGAHWLQASAALPLGPVATLPSESGNEDLNRAKSNTTAHAPIFEGIKSLPGFNWLSHPLSFTLDRSRTSKPLRTKRKAPTFPMLEGKTVSGELIRIPDVGKAKSTVVGLAFSLKAENDLKTWMQPAYDQFIAKPEGVFAANAYEGLFYFVGMAGGGAAGAMSQTFEKKAKSNIDAALQPHVILYKGNADAWVKGLEIKDKNQVHFIVLGPDGRVLHTTSGAYSESKMEALLEHAE